MNVIFNAQLALRLGCGLVSKEEQNSLKTSHFCHGILALSKMTAAVAAAATLGFVLPPGVHAAWWPNSFTQEGILGTKGGIICLCSGLAAGYWAFHQTSGPVIHHFSMTLDPETEVFRALKQDMQELFNIAIKMLITLGTIVVPTYIATKAIHCLLIG